MFNSSTLYIDRSAYENNINFIRGFVDENVLISSVVKGNAYGHGIETFVPLALENGIKHFSVYNAEEAFELKQIVKDRAEIMIMGFLSESAMIWAVEHEIDFYIFSLNQFRKAIDIACSRKKKARVHLEVETGMNRTGLSEEDFYAALDIMVENTDHVEFRGLCTHFAGAENIANYVRITDQKRKYQKFKNIVEERGLKPAYFHTCCSAATIRFPDMHFNMVRIGILQFGLWPSKEIFIEYLKDKKFKESPLRRLITWKTSIMTLKEVAIGEYIGYGTSYLAPKDMKIAIVPVGYAHGFARGLSNKGRAIVNGNRVPVIGIVNMNCLALNVNDIEDVNEGDEVILIGEQDGQSISISSFSEISEQVNYEMLTRLPHDIPRVLK